MVSKPSHHEIVVRNSLGSKCVPVHLKGGLRPKKWPKKHAEAERRQALFAGEDKSYKLLKVNYPAYESKISAREETQWQILERCMASEEETKLLKRLTPWIR